MPTSITKSDIDRLLQELSSQKKEIAAIGKSFREISFSLKQLKHSVNKLGME